MRARACLLPCAVLCSHEAVEGLAKDGQSAGSLKLPVSEAWDGALRI